MKPPSKKLILAFVAVILIFVVLAILLPKKETDGSRANLVLVSDTDQSIGSIGVCFARYDGSMTTEMCTNADGSPILRGESAWFDVNWPVTVTLYADLQGREVLTTYIVGEAPEEGCIWQLTVSDSTAGLRVTVNSVPKP